MPEFRVTGSRRVTIDQSGEAWVDAETFAEAKQLAGDDPDALDWNWDELDADDGEVDSIEIKTVEDIEETGEAPEEEEEA